MAAEPKKLIAAIRRGLDDPRYAHAWADLIGKVGKEIGHEAEHDTKPVIFHFYTNLNPMALAPSAQPRSLPAPPASPVAAPVGAGRAQAIPAAPSRTSKRAGATPPGGSP